MNIEEEILKVLDQYDAVLDELITLEGLDENDIGDLLFAHVDSEGGFSAVFEAVTAILKEEEAATADTLKWAISQPLIETVVKGNFHNSQSDASKLLRKSEHAVNTNRFYKALSGSDMDKSQLKHTWKNQEKKQNKYSDKNVVKLKEGARLRALGAALNSAYGDHPSGERKGRLKNTLKGVAKLTAVGAAGGIGLAAMGNPKHAAVMAASGAGLLHAAALNHTRKMYKAIRHRQKHHGEKE